jgi:YHS domain-containing protein
MESLAHLEDQIRKRLAAAQERRRHKQITLGREMEAREEGMLTFTAVARQLVDNVILPRLHKLAELFPNAKVTPADGVSAFGGTCEFSRTPEFPATTKLAIGVSPDAALDGAAVIYSLEILPAFFQFDRHDQIIIPFDGTYEPALSAWLDTKLLNLTDNYLRIRDIDQYQQENMAVDPVCGMRINRADAVAAAEHEGHMYYFCVNECRQKFLENPGHYIRSNKT